MRTRPATSRGAPGDPGSTRRTVDLNADVGEGGPDAELMAHLSSASIACGAHAGDDATMRATITLARGYGVAIGAHPGFPDRDGFGRRAATHDPAEIEALVVAQVERLAAHARAAGALVKYIKPHGALYNLAAAEPLVARAVVRAAERTVPGAPLVLLAASPGLAAARAEGRFAVAEGFVDRGYLSDGRLAPRAAPGALIDDPEEAARRAVALVTRGVVPSLDGTALHLAVATLCLHGDTPRAAEIARRVRAVLAAADVAIAPFAR